MLKKMRQKWKRGVNYPTLLHFDNFKAQCTPRIAYIVGNNFSSMCFGSFQTVLIAMDINVAK